MKIHRFCAPALTLVFLFIWLPAALVAAEDPSSTEPSTTVEPPISLREPNARDQLHAQNAVGLNPRRAYGKHPQLPIPQGDNLEVTVKFLDGFRTRSLPHGGISLLGGAIPPGLTDIVENNALTFRPSFHPDEDALAAFEREASDASGNAQPDFAGILAIDFNGRDKEDIMRICRELYALDCVEFVNINDLDNIAPPPGDIAPPTPDLRADQAWRQSAPGVDIDYAWSYLAQGQLTGVIDIEQGLEEEHEDIVDIGVMELSVGPYAGSTCNEDHGTGVIGILAAPDNGYGVTGAAVKAEKVGFISYNTTPSITQASAIVRATNNLNSGDIILLEIQTSGGVDLAGGRVFGFVPAEHSEPVHMATKTATDAGYIIVAAAGNGNDVDMGVDLDDSFFDPWRSWGDSGAIIVGAGSSDDNHWRLPFSTYGSRVNVQAWGENVLTSRTGASRSGSNCTPPADDIERLQTYANFSGTSSASAVTAAACTVLQSFSRQRYGSDMSPAVMRLLLNLTGIPQTAGGPAGAIGPCINVKNAIDGQIAAQLTPSNFPTNTFSFPQAVPISMYDEWQISEETGGADVSVNNARLEITAGGTNDAKFAIADLHVDLANGEEVALQFDYEKLDKAPFQGADMSSYTGIGEADGVFISDGSSTWHRIPIPGLTDQTAEDKSVTHRVSLNLIAQLTGISFNDDIRIRFQHFRPANQDDSIGIAIDNVSVEKGGINGTITFGSSSDMSVREGRTLDFEVLRDGPTDGDVNFELVFIAGSASAGSDFTDTTIVGMIPAGVEGTEVEIQFPNDSQIECIEYLTIKIQNPGGGATLGQILERTIYITDNDQVIGDDEYYFSKPASATILPDVPGVFRTGPPPIALSASNMTGTVASISAKIVGLSHDAAWDLDIFLESPAGTIVKLMSDTFPIDLISIDNLNLTFEADGIAQGNNPAVQPLMSQTYRPWDHQTGTDNLLDGTQVAGGNIDLSVFNGENPNGAWKLHIVDDTPQSLFAGPGFGGSLQGGWELSITTEPVLLDDFRIVAVERSPDALVLLSWNSQLGRTYQIQRSTDLTSWTDIGSEVNGVDGVRTHGFTSVVISQQSYYRVLDTTGQ